MIGFEPCCCPENLLAIPVYVVLHIMLHAARECFYSRNGKDGSGSNGAGISYASVRQEQLFDSWRNYSECFWCTPCSVDGRCWKVLLKLICPKAHVLACRHNTNIIVVHLRKINSFIKNMLILGTANLYGRLDINQIHRSYKSAILWIILKWASY